MVKQTQVQVMQETLGALAEPHRMQIVEFLRQGPKPVGDIVETLHLRQPQVSKHLKVLLDAGLVEVTPDAQRRIYALKTQPLYNLDLWLASYRVFWESSLDRLDDYLQQTQTDEKQKTGKKL